MLVSGFYQPATTPWAKHNTGAGMKPAPSSYTTQENVGSIAPKARTPFLMIPLLQLSFDDPGSDGLVAQVALLIQVASDQSDGVLQHSSVQ